MKTVLQGMIMGVAEVIPGVSGSTLALAMGIYEKFIDLLHDISGAFKSRDLKAQLNKIDFRFGSKLVLGMAISIALFSNLLSALMEMYPQYVYSFFFGLVLASIAIPWSEMKVRGWFELLIGVISFVLFSIFITNVNTSAPVGSAPPAEIWFFFGGVLGITGMIMPGVSGSFVLLSLGLYYHVISAVRDLTRMQISVQDGVNLALFAVGLLVGFISFVQIVQYALKHWHSRFMAAVMGILLASLQVIWPVGISAQELPLSLVMVLFGVLVVLVLRRYRFD